ncbi:HAMP domain-containing sensor histidine kinase [Wukongibacter baidiensis]|uniref:sensor histidine kinase n=1 Tax=Wukongibacter baidiensis TaxID=1723361 RepID=UPI003D7F6C07
MKKWIFISFSIFIVLFILTIFFLQTTISDEYYYREKYKSIIKDCEELEKKYITFQQEGKPAKVGVEFANYMLNSGNGVIFLDENKKIIFSLSANINYPSKENFEKTFNEIFGHVMQEEESGYFIENIKHLKNDYLLAIHPFKGGEKLIVLSSIKKTKEAIEIINILLFKILAISSIIALVIINFLSNTLSKSILLLTRKAQEVTDLKFNEPIDVKGPKEIRLLGDAFNFLSHKLGETIDKLNKANVKLKEDINLKVEQERMRRQFVSDASHELKTPITIIKSYSEALMDGVGDKSYYLQGINEESNRMENMVEELLELSRLESDTVSLVFEPIILNNLIEFNIKKLIAIADKYNRVIRFHSSMEDIEIEGDRDKIDRVVKNLIMNALVYSTEEFIDVSLTVHDKKVLLSVYNKSKVMPKDEIERIWDRFYKIDKSRNRKRSGSGLGLAIVKNIVEKHHGEYGVEAIDGGLRFWVKLNIGRDKQLQGLINFKEKM